jgi:thiol-disulfide isomerase/thioredoxin
MPSVKELATESDWYREVDKSEMPVAVEFYAPWCEPCKELEPVFKEAAKEFDNIKFFRYNMDKLYVYASRHNVTGIPTILLMKKKTFGASNLYVETIKGYTTLKKLKSRLENLISYVIPGD